MLERDVVGHVLQDVLVAGVMRPQRHAPVVRLHSVRPALARRAGEEDVAWDVRHEVVLGDEGGTSRPLVPERGRRGGER